MRNERLISFLLRAGIATAFLYAAIAAFLEPLSWIGFLPAWIERVAPRAVVLAFFSTYEMALALWLLSGTRVFRASALSSVTLLGIIIFNVSSLDVLFRDIPILFATLALMAMAKKQ